MLRARLSLFALEGRENPSGPSPIDPIGVPGPVPPPSDPPPPPPESPAVVAIINAGGSVAGGVNPTPTPPPASGPIDPFVGGPFVG